MNNLNEKELDLTVLIEKVRKVDYLTQELEELKVNYKIRGDKIIKQQEMNNELRCEINRQNSSIDRLKKAIAIIVGCDCDE